jgi:hypothetical protein
VTYRWRDHEAARAELLEAARFLEDERAGLGEQFMDAVEAALRSIVDSPLAWGLRRGRRYDPPVHSRSVVGFRYDIKYIVIGDDIVVIAYAHERRRPGYWTARLND